MKKAHPRTGRTDHFGQSLLTDFGNYCLGRAFLAKMREQKKDASQAFFAGVE
jgi:hypothetical protein